MRILVKGVSFGSTSAMEPRPSRVDLDAASVARALEKGVKIGDRITVSVKVGKRRRLYKATLRGYVQTCCMEHINTPYAYYAER